MQCGRVECEPEERTRGVDLGLYSVTFNNNCELDLETLNQYKAFREEAERKGFPESFNLRALLQFMQDVKSGKPGVRVPVYSHEIYDQVLPY